MNQQVAQKLEWPALVSNLAGYCQTEEGRDQCLRLQPALKREAIEESWSLTIPLREITSKGYRAPIGQLPNLELILKSASLGQVLGGEEFRDVVVVLDATKNTLNFVNDFADKCSTLLKFKARLYPIPTLSEEIKRAVAEDGSLRDDASDELQRIRRQKLSLRKKIEDQLVQVIHNSDFEPYIQDDFFTVRSERYVVPMKLDGRGRMKGSILDTSDSGQTLYIEPSVITPLNDQKQELDLAEKLEIIRIFRHLSSLVGQHSEDLKINYRELIALDVLTAKAALAVDHSAGSVKLTTSGMINLVDARHPLIRRPDGNPAVGNSVALKEGKTVMIISGPNAGGKTIVLKTVGLLHLMARAGLLIPADERSQLRLYDQVFLEMGDSQDLSANLSTFTGHLMGLKPILGQVGANDLVLLDELAVGTDPQTGASIAQAVLEEFADRKCSTFVTTHFEALKGLAISDKRFRNGSMEFSLETLKPTYKLIQDVPGQSYGVEVAEQLGFPDHLIKRAKELRGGSVSTLDEAVSQLMHARDETRKLQEDVAREKLKASEEKGRWEQECRLMQEQRQKLSSKLSAKYDGQIRELRSELDDLIKKLRKAYKDAPNRDEVLQDRQQAEGKLKQMESFVNEMKSGYDAEDKLPGKTVSFSDLEVGRSVYVIPLKNTGTIVSLGDSKEEPIEVEVGMIKLRVNLQDLRSSNLQPPKSKKSSQGKRKPQGGEEDYSIGFVLPTHTNSVDLRGMDKDQALEAAWNFIDRAMMRGEAQLILIHGHGTGALTHTIRDALKSSCPYDVAFRPGEDSEGGNGVTVVQLR